jgi:hypothetical protein
MESKAGHGRWRWLAMVAALCFGAGGLGLLACGGHSLPTAHPSADAAGVLEDSGMATDAKVLAWEDAGSIASDSSRSPCPTVTGNYGACEAVLGWGFDGKVCRQWSGCDCAPDCGRLFPTAQTCAQACRAQGACNSEALVSGGIAHFAVGESCDSLLACVPAGLEGQLGLDLAGNCQAGGICAAAQTCLLKLPPVIDQADWDRYCTASLISGVSIECSKRLL